jgi:hypothetical protein
MHANTLRHLAGLAAACILLALAACTTPPPPRLDASSVKRIGIVSLLGDSFTGRYFSITSTPYTSFGNHSFNAQVPDWAIDRYAARNAVELIRSAGRIEAVALNDTGTSGQQLAADDRRLMWELATRQGLDTLAVIHADERDTAFADSPYGLYERASAVERDQRCVYAWVVVELFDVATRKSLGRQYGADTPCAFGHDEDLVFKGGFDDYSSGERLAMRQRLERRLGLSLRNALDGLSLLGRAKT